jgi:glycosyltransferase involved in cell wall biosynthesis
VKEKFRIAIIGTRGIPAAYGGFETFAEELSTRLVAKGHHVTVFGRRRFFEKEKDDVKTYRGVLLKTAPTIMTKYAETVVNALFSFLYITKNDAHIILLCNAANSPFAWIARLRGFKVAVNVDGIERKRGKWNWCGKLWYMLGEMSSVYFCNKIIADAEVIAEYYRERYSVQPEVIAYGANGEKWTSKKVLERFNVEENRYILYVSRLEPENNALCVIHAYRQLTTNIPLVIVGDAPYASDYKRALIEAAGELGENVQLVYKEAQSANDSFSKERQKRIIFTGFQFGDSYKELQSHALLYVQATEVGGTHPALIEAMAYGNCIIANCTPENKEVLGDAGLFYTKNNAFSLAEKLNFLLQNPEKVELFRTLARERAAIKYSWERIVEQYEDFFCRL